MSIQAGRKGVRKDQVDYLGRVNSGGGSSDLEPRVETLETNVSAIRTRVTAVEGAVEDVEGQLDTFEFRTDTETGKAQYRPDADSEWSDFSSGGGSVIGFNLPDDIGTAFSGGDTVVSGSGRYYTDETTGITYIKGSFTVHTTDTYSHTISDNIPNIDASKGSYAVLSVSKRDGNINGTASSKKIWIPFISGTDSTLAIIPDSAIYSVGNTYDFYGQYYSVAPTI